MPAARKPKPPTGGTKKATSRAASVSARKRASNQSMASNLKYGLFEAAARPGREIDNRISTRGGGDNAPPGAAKSPSAAGYKKMLGDKKTSAKKSGKVPAMTPLKRRSSRAGSMDPAIRQDTGSAYPRQNTGRYYTAPTRRGKGPQDRVEVKVRTSTATSRKRGDLTDGDLIVRPRARKAAGAAKKTGRK